jgi:hypothetical protein
VIVPITQVEAPVPTRDKSEEVSPEIFSEKTIEKVIDVEFVRDVFGVNELTAVDG